MQTNIKVIDGFLILQKNAEHETLQYKDDSADSLATLFCGGFRFVACQTIFCCHISFSFRDKAFSKKYAIQWLKTDKS